MLGGPVAEVRHAVPGEVQVEPPQDRAVLGDEHVVGAGVLLGQHRTVPLGELIEEVVAAIGDGGGEVGAVRPLEREDRGLMARVQGLKLRHGLTLTPRRASGRLGPQ